MGKLVSKEEWGKILGIKYNYNRYLLVFFVINCKTF